VTRILARVETGSGNPLPYDQRYGFPRKAGKTYMAVAVYRTEYRSLCDLRGCEPFVERGDRTPATPTEGNGDLAALAALVGLGPLQAENGPLANVLHIPHV
jgi:hypothetical protein